MRGAGTCRENPRGASFGCPERAAARAARRARSAPRAAGPQASASAAAEAQTTSFGAARGSSASPFRAHTRTKRQTSSLHRQRVHRVSARPVRRRSWSRAVSGLRRRESPVDVTGGQSRHPSPWRERLRRARSGSASASASAEPRVFERSRRGARRSDRLRWAGRRAGPIWHTDRFITSDPPERGAVLLA